MERNSSKIYGKLASTGDGVCVNVQGGKITSVIPAPADSMGPEALWLSAGLVDLQINGFAGHDLNLAAASLEERVDAVCAMTREVLKSGTTSFCPTVITAGFEQIRDAMNAIRIACERDPLVRSCVLGIHLEGPYLSELDGPRGAHPREHIKDPDWQEFSAWQEAAGGRIRIVTLAPERPGAVPFIRKLAAQGILASIGHSAASHEEITAAADAGATLSTHLGNGAHPQLPRHPNYIWSQLAEERLTPSIIADGHHLHPSVVKVMTRAKGRNLILVSDAVHLAGMKPGIYKTHVGGEVELLPSGRLQTTANPLILAGAAVSLADCVQGFMRFTASELQEALLPATGLPARILEETQIGEVRTGFYADLIAFTLDTESGMRIRSIYKRGEKVSL